MSYDLSYHISDVEMAELVAERAERERSAGKATATANAAQPRVISAEEAALDRRIAELEAQLRTIRANATTPTRSTTATTAPAPANASKAQSRENAKRERIADLNDAIAERIKATKSVPNK